MALDNSAMVLLQCAQRRLGWGCSVGGPFASVLVQYL